MKKSIFLFFAAILCAMTANAYNQSAKDLYFDNSEAKWEKCFVYIGKGNYTSCYDMTRVPGTQYLWQLPANFNGGNAWNGATGWVVCYEKWWASSQETIDKYIWHGDNNVTKKSTSAWVDTKIYKTNGAANATSDGTTKKVYTVTSYTKADYAVTINTVEGGTLTVKDYDNNAVATGASKIHLTVLKFSATPASGYVLDGVEINDGTNTTTIAAADLATKTHTLTSAVTITPVWRATTSTVTVTATATNGTVTGEGVVEEGTDVTLTATPADGYKFVNWTVGGVEVSTANPYTFTAEEDVTVVANFEELPKTTVYFINTPGWTNVKAYAYSPANASWPGVDATLEAEKIGEFEVYSYTVTVGKYANVIFNGSGGQTADLTWTDGKYYIHNHNKNTGWYTQAEAEEIVVVPVEYEYVYLINTNDWAKAHIYTWTPEVAGWPGAAMTKEAEQIAGKDVYSYKAVKGSAFGGMLFNNGDGTQTGDLKWEAGKYYAPSKNEWYADAAAAEAGLAAPVVHTYTLVGSDNLFGSAWSPAAAANDMEKQDDGSYKKVYSNVELTSDVIWKIAKNHDWWNGPTFNENNNTLTIAKSGIYNVTFTLSKDLATATAEAELLEETNKVADCFISGNAALTGAGSEAEAWKGNEFKMEYAEATQTYSYTLSLHAETAYELKVVLGDWYGYEKLQTVPAGVENKEGNIAFKLAEAGDVTVTYNKDNGINIAGNFALPVTYDYYITGCEKLGANWGANVEAFGMTDENEDKTYEKALTLAAGEYYLKVTDGTWTDGKNWGSAALSEKYTEISDSGGNIKITLSAEKTFTVKFNSETKKISFEGLTPDETPTKYYIVGSFNEWNTADPNYELILDSEVYKKEVTFAKDVQFKVCDGTWANSWGKDNLGSKLYKELEGLEGGNLKMKEDKTFTIIFDLANNLITFEGLTEKAPAVVTYVLMGVNNDWTTGIPMTQKANEYVLTCQAIAATDAVKVVKCEDGVATAWYGSVKDGVQVTVNYDADGNIQLPVGTYNFYFDSSLDDKQLWIESATYTRDVTPGSFSTICLPYAGTISGATLFNLSDRDANYVYVVEAGIELEAGKPYVILPTEDKITVTYKNYDYVAAGSNNALYGTYEDMDATALDGKYVISGNKYYYVDAVHSAGSKLLANRAYFNLYDLPTAPASAPGARRIALGTNGQNTATGMENVDASAQPVKTIINGQLYILRGEKMYDAQGKLVK